MSHTCLSDQYAGAPQAPPAVPPCDSSIAPPALPRDPASWSGPVAKDPNPAQPFVPSCGSDPLCGGSSAAVEISTVSDGLKVLSGNVTVLTKDRLTTILTCAERAGAQIIALQETRHHSDTGFPFANRLATKKGWSITWSKAPPMHGNPRLHRRKEGGCALLWRKELGRGKPIASSEHRFCARIWDFGCFASVYGPAGVADNAWLQRCLTTMTNHRRPSFLIGDFNWVSAYSRSLPGSWFVSDNFPTVIGADAGPTRVVSLRQFGGPEKPSLAEALPGIPHHKATVWTCPKFPHEQVPLRRLRRCARFEPATKPTDAQRKLLEREARELWNNRLPHLDAQCEDDETILRHLDSLLSHWNAVAEKFFNKASSMHLVQGPTGVERAKGSEPSTKSWASSKCGRGSDEPVAVRRCKRLHRAAAEQLRRGNGHELSPAQRRHWSAALADNLEPKAIPRMPANQFEALDFANRALQVLSRREAAASKTSWVQRFKTWSQDACQAAKAVVKPQAPPQPTTAEELKDEWSTYLLKPDNPDRASEWRALAQEGGLSSSSERAPAVVPFEDFLAAAAAAKGVPGLDGWTSAEVKFLAQECPWLLARLHSVLQGLLTRASGIDLSSHPACRMLYSWRLAGVPKRGSEESRPIAVGSVLLRAWNKALLSLLPPTPQGQWGNRKKSSVIHATEDWIKAPGTSGVELDLAK